MANPARLHELTMQDWMKIFNRWGEVVYYSEDPEQPWQGNVEEGRTTRLMASTSTKSESNAIPAPSCSRATFTF